VVLPIIIILLPMNKTAREEAGSISHTGGDHISTSHHLSATTTSYRSFQLAIPSAHPYLTPSTQDCLSDLLRR